MLETDTNGSGNIFSCERELRSFRHRIQKMTDRWAQLRSTNYGRITSGSTLSTIFEQGFSASRK